MDKHALIQKASELLELPEDCINDVVNTCDYPFTFAKLIYDEIKDTQVTLPQFICPSTGQVYLPWDWWCTHSVVFKNLFEKDIKANTCLVSGIISVLTEAMFELAES